MKQLKSPSYRFLFIFIIPLISLVWGFYTYYSSLPFFVKGSDPEYPYLINGLNCALLHFERIGHTDHPGTPFQLIIGLILRLTHLIAGKDDLMTDVFQRPEFYLGAVSIFLTLIQSALIAFVGTIGIKNHKLLPVITLQLTPFYHHILFNLYGRVNPDRFFVIVTLLFLIVLLKYAFTNKPDYKKLAIASGIVMGLGFATKFNYIPVIIFPLFLLNNWKQRGIYAGTGILSFTIFISPMLQKFPEFRRFILGIVSHDGLYGAGNSQVFNLTKIVENIKLIFTLNPGLIFIIGSILFFILFLSLRHTEKKKQYILFMIGYFCLIVIQLIIVSKHFKNYYLTPLFTMYGLFFFVSFQIIEKSTSSKRIITTSMIIIPLLFFAPSLRKTINDKQSMISQNEQKQEEALFMKNQINKDDYWLIEPTWESGPLVENALVYGLCYCANRDDYEDILNHINPHVLTFEIGNQTLMTWKCSYASLDTVLTSGQNINIYSSPGRHAQQLINYTQKESEALGFTLSIDTINKQNEISTYIIQLKSNINKEELQAINTQLKLENKKNQQSKKNQLIEKYTRQINESPDWLASVTQKAKKRGISLDSMIYLDAVYMAEQH